MSSNFFIPIDKIKNEKNNQSQEKKTEEKDIRVCYIEEGNFVNNKTYKESKFILCEEKYCNN